MATRKPPSKKAADTPLPKADTPSAATTDESPPMAVSAGSGDPAAEAARQEAPTAQAESMVVFASANNDRAMVLLNGSRWA